jgi:hypothetical protein
MNDRLVADDDALDIQSVRGDLDQAAFRLAAAVSPNLWEVWVVHFLRILQNKADSETYTDFLEVLKTRISNHLETGRW